MRNLARDIAHAARRLWQSPGFTTAAVLTLALGIGANTAIFTLAYATVLRPVQVHRPEQLVTVPWSSSYPDYAEYAGRTDIFTGVAAIAGAGRANITTDDSSDLAEMAFVTGNTFDLLGVRAALGRILLPSDDVVNGPEVAVLAHDYWRSHFGGDPAVVGRTIRINARTVTIIGVAEKGFRGTRLASNPALFAPLSSVQALQTGFLSKVPFRTSRGFVWLTAIARLRTDVPWARAEAEMDAMYRRQHPPQPGEPVERLTFEPLASRALGRDAALTRQFVTLLFGVVGMTLLIGCANLANLLLARAAARRGEIGIRLALGATRGRIVMQMLVESTLLATLGGAVGVGVAAACLQAFSAYQLPGNLRSFEGPAPSGRDVARCHHRPFTAHGTPVWRGARLACLANRRSVVALGAIPKCHRTRPSAKCAARNPGGDEPGPAHRRRTLHPQPGCRDGPPSWLRCNPGRHRLCQPWTGTLRHRTCGSLLFVGTRVSARAPASGIGGLEHRGPDCRRTLVGDLDRGLSAHAAGRCHGGDGPRHTAVFPDRGNAGRAKGAISPRRMCIQRLSSPS